MAPLHTHLENWDFHSPRNVARKRLDERFHERFEMPLLKIFQKYACSYLLHSLPESFIDPFKTSYYCGINFISTLHPPGKSTFCVGDHLLSNTVSNFAPRMSPLEVK
jgi:hypothetical protein